MFKIMLISVMKIRMLCVNKSELRPKKLNMLMISDYFINIKLIIETLKIKVALAHPAASKGVCSHHRSKFH